jgi:hypothetical protein
MAVAAVSGAVVAGTELLAGGAVARPAATCRAVACGAAARQLLRTCAVGPERLGQTVGAAQQYVGG